MKNDLETEYKNKKLFLTYRLHLSNKMTRANTTTAALSNDDISMISKWLLISSSECSEIGYQMYGMTVCAYMKNILFH